MHFRVFARSKGRGSGPVDYLIDQTAPGRELRPPDVLAGEPELTRSLIDCVHFQHRYTSGVLSFHPDDNPTEEQQRQLMGEFEKLAFAGLDRTHFYILWVRHSHLSRVELHFVVPRVDLVTGQSLNVAPPGWEGTFYPLRDAWNYEHNWARPDDPLRARDRQSGSAAAAEAHRLRNNLPAMPDPKSAIHEFLCARIESGLIADRAGIAAALADAGFEITRAGKNYLTARDPESGERYRLKGTLYEEGFSAANFIRPAPREDRARTSGNREDHARCALEARTRLRARMESRARFNRERVAKWNQRTQQEMHLRHRENDFAGPGKTEHGKPLGSASGEAVASAPGVGVAGSDWDGGILSWSAGLSVLDQYGWAQIASSGHVGPTRDFGITGNSADAGESNLGRAPARKSGGQIHHAAEQHREWLDLLGQAVPSAEIDGAVTHADIRTRGRIAEIHRAAERGVRAVSRGLSERSERVDRTLYECARRWNACTREALESIRRIHAIFGRAAAELRDTFVRIGRAIAGIGGLSRQLEHQIIEFTRYVERRLVLLREKRSITTTVDTGADLTAFLYQRDGEIIAFARPDLAVSGMGSWPVAQVVDIRAPSAV